MYFLRGKDEIVTSVLNIGYSIWDYLISTHRDDVCLEISGYFEIYLF